MNLKKNSTPADAPVENSLEKLLVNRFDLQLAKINTLSEQYVILSQRIASTEKSQAEMLDLGKSIFAKLITLQKQLESETPRKNASQSVMEVAGSAIPQAASQSKKSKPLTINQVDHLGLRKELAEENYHDFEEFYELFKIWNREFKLYGKKDQRMKAQGLFDSIKSMIEDQDLESECLFPETNPEPEKKAPSQLEVWANQMSVTQTNLQKVVDYIRKEITPEEEIDLMATLEFLGIPSSHASVKAFSRWLDSLILKK
jgi:hypothetical protein